MRRRRQLALLTLCLLLAWSTMRATLSLLPGHALAEGRPQFPLGQQERLLFVAPHPDDETLAAAGLLQRVLAQGGQVRIVVLTCGDGYSLAARNYYRRPEISPSGYLRFGQVRMRETKHALNLLGIDPAAAIFLGYPDRGLATLWVTGQATSRYTGVSAVPYRECYRPGAPYTRRELEEQLQYLVTSFRPSLVVLPDPGDGHPDHRAAFHLVREAFSCASGCGPCRAALYRVHPRNRSGVMEQYLGRPTGVEQGDGVFTLVLTGAERAAKRQAVLAYRTQQAVWSEFFLHSFLGPVETFRPIDLASSGGTSP